MNYVLGLDVGIGSVGWAVVRNDDDNKRIEDFGVRIFDSGENPKDSKRNSQERREFRSARRLLRRRAHRKQRLKNHLTNINLTTEERIKKYFETCSSDIISVRVKAINEKVSPEELTACLIHICNYRGYNPFYDDFDDMSSQEAKEAKENGEALSVISEIMKNGQYRTVAEMIAKDDYFASGNGKFKRYRNSAFNPNTVIFDREMLKNEAKTILEKQKEYYPQLTDTNIEKTIEIIFSQRDFEDGPGDVNDPHRAYMGFLDSIGKCAYYKDENRGCRSTVIADLYSLVNILSQCNFINGETGEYGLSPDLAKAFIDYALANGNLTKTDIKKICKEKKFEINMYEGEGEQSIGNCFKFTKKIKPIFEKYGYSWAELTKDYNDMDSLINRISIILAENITPKRRIKKLESVPELSKDIINELKSVSTSGTARVSYRFMQDSIAAFLRGDIIGNFSANIVKENAETKKHDTLPPFDKNSDFFNNPVVFRSINETRKIINAVIRKYGTPNDINIEVASELNKSLENRNNDSRNIKQNEKKKESAASAIKEITGVDEVRPSMLERYLLGEEQGWVCLYSGKPIDKKEAIINRNKYYEVDHIVPFSLILDDTLANKALVLTDENQFKKQRTPLMYMDAEKTKEFKKRVNAIYNKKKGNLKKYKYLMLNSLDEGVLKEWKSRNLNDTRYISKYLVNYIKTNLKFKDDKKVHIYAVKGAITSMMRKQWLNKDTWGIKDKSELKKITYLDHAVDAIVIANCIPGYVEIASLNMRLRNIFYSSGKRVTEEYINTLEEGMKNIQRFHGISKSVSKPLLERKKLAPSLIPDLRHEVDLRVTDLDLSRRFNDFSEKTDEEIIDLFKLKVQERYANDPEFASSIKMPLFSLKQDKRINKSFGADNPLSIKESDGEKYIVKTVAVKNLKKKDINSVRTNDPLLKEALEKLFEGMSNDTTGEAALADKNMDSLIVNGTVVNKVKKNEKTAGNYMTKRISDNNYTNLDIRSYYCIELYKDKEGNTLTMGIPYAYLVLKNGKLYLSDDFKYPKDYERHIDYLFAGDYVEIFNKKGEIKASGYYKGIKNINESRFYFLFDNCNEFKIVSIAKKDRIRKYSVDLLGNKNEVRKKCGELLSLAKVKN